MYLENGYLDIAFLDSVAAPFNVCVGGRGIGKTYGLLKYYLDRGETIIYMRRTDVQAQIAASKAFCPYKSICEDMGQEYEVSHTKPKMIFVDLMESPAAYVVPLSTFANVRGFDGSDCAAIVYDEFIPEKNEKGIKDEGEALLQAYETVNRNRELKEKPPCKLWMIANSNRIDSPIFAELGIMGRMLKMSERGVERDVIRERGLQLIHVHRSPISAAKAETALYKLVDTSYKDMALGNKYRASTDGIVSRDLSQYRPICRVGELTVYKSKSEPRYYITPHKSGTVPVFGTGETEIARFKRKYGALVDLYMLGYFDVESVEVDYMWKTLLNL